MTDERTNPLLPYWEHGKRDRDDGQPQLTPPEYHYSKEREEAWHAGYEGRPCPAQKGKR